VITLNPTFSRLRPLEVLVGVREKGPLKVMLSTLALVLITAMGILKYPLPAFLKGVQTPRAYSHWVVGKSADVYRRDCMRKRPFALNSSQGEYGNEIHEAVIEGNGIDPFTGDSLRYDLIDKYDPVKARGDIAYEKSFDLLPAVDHIDPEAEVLALEICSQRMNLCKSEQNPAEFLGMCRTIVEHCGKKVDGRNPQPNLLLNLAPPFPPQGELADGTPFTVPAVYLLPGYLEGRCSQVLFRKWVDWIAEERLVRDRKIKRPYAIEGHMLLYKQVIYKASLVGEFDPFTGEFLLWELIGQWDPAKRSPDAVNFKKFALLPTVDHIDPASDILQMEICSWKINTCKGNLNPQEFVELCRRVIGYRDKRG
jgi:hypothetical protein